MVDVHLSEEEQVEALKKWWKENGRSVIGGLVLGLGAVFGWKMWVDYRTDIANQASARFEQLNQSLTASALGAAGGQAESLINDYQGTAYAVFAAMDLARIKLEQGDAEGAVAQLKWALDNSGQRSFRQIIRLRMARILVGNGQLDEAAALIEAGDSDSFGGEIAEVRGDIARARGDVAAARLAYQDALANQVSNPNDVQMKLDDLAVNP